MSEPMLGVYWNWKLITRGSQGGSGRYMTTDVFKKIKWHWVLIYNHISKRAEDQFWYVIAVLFAPLHLSQGLKFEPMLSNYKKMEIDNWRFLKTYDATGQKNQIITRISMHIHSLQKNLRINSINITIILRKSKNRSNDIL